MIFLFLGFLLGALSIVIAEVVALFFILQRLLRKKETQTSEPQVGRHLDAEQSLTFAFNKKGVVWILEPEKVPKVSTNNLSTKVPKEQKNKKEIVEVFPIKKHAKIQDRSLILTDSDGSQAKIQLLGCIIEAVSASNLSTRKWAKRYPIRIENRKAIVYNGSKTCYVYFETSWEKESWCKALRLASSEDNKRLDWYFKLNQEFQHYLASLNAEYPLFMKPSKGLGEPTDKANKIDDSSSKVRLFLKKLAKKAAKSSAEPRPSGISSAVHQEKKNSGKMHVIQDALVIAPHKVSSSEKTLISSFEDDEALPASSGLAHSGSQSQVSVFSDADNDEKYGNDEGTFCWNVLFSRLFFDAKRSTELKSFIQARIQRTLSSMRIPSYIGDVTCTSLNIGNLPPYIHSMRVLPMDMNEVWAVEVDIEYSGGAILEIETRLEVREPEFEKGLESSAAGEVTADILEDFEQYGNELKLSKEAADKIEKSDEGDNLDGMKNSRSTSWKSNYVSRWKAIVNSVAEQVSQVPLSLAIRVTSLRGTLRLHIKPPPSDQVWFGFTSMPAIDWNLESSVGEHKITSGHIALLISSRFKAAIRDTLVLPNCESVCIPWMLAEKDDWVPRNVAPFIWLHQEAESATRDASNCHCGEGKVKPNTSNKDVKNSSSNILDGDSSKAKDVVSAQKPPSDSLSESSSSSQSGQSLLVSNDQSVHSNALDDLSVPLLQGDETPRNGEHSSRSESPDNSSGAIVITEGKISSIGEDMKSKKIGRRAKMLDLGKKMGEKLEEKRRHIEERSRHIVDKMRGGYDA